MKAVNNLLRLVGLGNPTVEVSKDYGVTGDDLRRMLEERSKLEDQLATDHGIILLERLVVLDERINSVFQLRDGEEIKALAN